MKFILVAGICITSMLTGCDSSFEKMGAILSDEPMTVAISPGFAIENFGKPAFVFGHDECPKDDRAMNLLIGPPPHEGSSDCLVIKPNAKTVLAQVVIDDKLTNEVWTVKHYENRPFKVALLRQPGGLPVVAYDAYLKAHPDLKDLRTQTHDRQGLAASAPTI